MATTNYLKLLTSDVIVSLEMRGTSYASAKRLVTARKDFTRHGSFYCYVGSNVWHVEPAKGMVGHCV